ncbi:tonB-dependent receptor plug [Bacteroides sp. CAG:443]|nr:tonB-dependent receptor plug [Bacteroides sp. CAG:443]
MKTNKRQTLKNGLFLALAACWGTVPMQAEVEKVMGSVALTEQQASQYIKGTVLDENNEPVVGANVIIKGTSNGTVTDVNGKFSLNVREGQTIVVSFIGYVSQEITVSGKKQYTVDLEPESQLIDEVIVTGYQTISKERAAGSFSIVNQKDMEDKLQTNILDRMEGMVAGMKVNGSTPEIRGISTLNANKTPLYVVDGIPYEGSLDAINPSDIVNVTVLKDASAASIYGAQSANGVIVITTRSGEQGKPKVRYNGSIKFEPLPDRDYMNLMSSAELVDLQKVLFNCFHNTYAPTSPSFTNEVYDLLYRNEAGELSDSELESQLDVYRNRDRYDQIKDEFVRRSNTTHQHNLSISGGSDIYKYALSANFQQNLPHAKEQKTNRYGFNFKNQFDFFKWLHVDLGILNSTVSQDYDNGFSGYSYLYSGPSYRMIRNEDGSPAQWYMTGKSQREIDRLNGLGLYDETFYPVNGVNTAHYQDKQQYWNINLGATFKIIKGLTFDVRYQTEMTNSYTKQYNSINHYSVTSMINNATVLNSDGTTTHYIPEGGNLSEYWGKDHSYTLRAQINFSRDFKKKHSIQVIAGAERRKVVNQTTQLYKYGYDDNSLSWKAIDELAMGQGIRGTQSTSGSFYFSTYRLGTDGFTYDDNRYVSFYGNASYTYNNRTTLTGSIRIDQSNLFGTDPKYQYKPLWSVGLQHIILENKGVLDRLAGRLTYGINGNVAKDTGPYMIVADDGTNYYTNEYQAYVVSAPNPMLRWEKTKLVNVGVDFNLFGNRLNGSLEFYNKATSDLLGNRLVDSTFGWTSLMLNYGAMVNRGVEISLQSEIVRTRDFSFGIDFMFSYNKNKLTQIDDSGTSAYSYYGSYQNREGYPMSSIFAIRYAGLDSEGNPTAYKADGTVINSVNDLEAEDLVYKGTTIAPYSSSLTARFGYKNFDLSMMFVYYGGNVMRDVASSYQFTMYPVLNYASNMDRDRLKFWQKPGDELDPDMNPAFQYRNGKTCYQLWQYADKHIERGDYIKLRDITLGYTFPKQWLRSAYIQGLRLSLQIQNAFYWAANKKNLDPEVATPTSRGQHIPATYTFGVALDF